MALLSKYEEWYRDGGLATYASVFGCNDEKKIETELVAHRVRERLTGPGPVEVLDIGCGTGRFTVGLLESVCSGRATACEVTVDLVDINPDAFDRFRQTAASASHARLSVRNTMCLAWRDALGLESLPIYTLVIADHAFYGEPMVPKLVSSLLMRLSPKGVAIVTLETRTCELFEMRARAAISTNSAEDFETLLTAEGCRYESLEYESRLHFDPNMTSFRDWFFASSSLPDDDRQILLEEFSRRDELGNCYISNRARIFLLSRGDR